MNRRTLLCAAAVALVVVACKGLLVLSLADVFLYGEELEKGTAAKAMLDGLGVPHHQLAYHYYEGGGFTVSHLTALSFLLVGENLLAHKLVSLAFNVAIALAGFALVKRWFGLAAAVCFGLVFALAPAGIQKISLLNLGIHYESLLFLLLLVGQTLALLATDAPRPRQVALFGLTAGFGAFFSYQTLPLTAFLGVVLLVRRRGRVRSLRPGLLIASGIVGALPLIGMFAAVGTQVFDIHGTALVGGDDGESDETDAGEGVEEDVEGTAATAPSTDPRPRSLDERPEGSAGRPGKVVRPERGSLAKTGTFLYTLLVGRAESRGEEEPLHRFVLRFVRFVVAALLPFVGLALALRRGGTYRSAYLLLFGYGLFYAVVYLASPFVVEVAYHHFLLQRTTPFWMIGVLLSSATVGALLTADAGKLRVRGALCLLALLAHGVEGKVENVREGRPGPWAENLALLRTAKGYTYAEYLAKFFQHLEDDSRERLEVALRFDEPSGSLLRSEIATALYAKTNRTPTNIVEELREVDPERWRAYLPGLGQYFFRRGANNMEVALRIALNQDPELRPLFVEGLGRRGLHLRTQPEALDVELADLAGSELPGAYYRGLGHRVFQGFRLDPDGAEAYLGTVPARYRPMVRRGYETARAERTLGAAPTE